MSCDPEVSFPPEISLEEERLIVEEILSDQPWVIEDISGGFTRETRSFVAPLLDGTTVTIQEIIGTKNHKYIINRESFGEHTNWGWFTDIEEIRWVVDKKFVLHEGDEELPFKLNTSSTNKIEGEYLESLGIALNDARIYRDRVLADKLLKEEAALQASYDPELEEKILNIYFSEHGEVDLGTIRRLGKILEIKHKISEVAALEAIDRLAERIGEDPQPLVTVVPFEREMETIEEEINGEA